MTLKIDLVEYLHHNNLGFYTPRYTLNSLAIRGEIFPTSPSCGYDSNLGILCKYQYRLETSANLWVIDRGAKYKTLLSRYASTLRALHLISSLWELRQGGKSLLSVLD